jgi:hypothetical protein
VFSSRPGEKNFWFFRRATVFSFVVSLIDASLEVFTIVKSDATCLRGFMIVSQGYSAVYQSLSNLILCCIYVTLLIIPHTKYRHLLPTKKSYYLYLLYCLTMDIFFCVGGFLMGDCIDSGICFSGIGYFMCFAFFPIVLYIAFLAEYLSPEYYSALSDDVSPRAITALSPLHIVQLASPTRYNANKVH